MIIVQTRPATDLAEADRQLKDLYAAFNKRLTADNIILKHADTLGRTVDDHHAQLHNAPSHLDITSSGADIEDAVTRRHDEAHTLTSHTTKAHSELTGVAADQHHLHANKAQIDLVTDGDHDVRTDNPHTVSKTQMGLGNVENLKVNLIATVAPVATNDSNDGYAVGSRWVDVIADKEYVCLDATVGVAVWLETTAVGIGGIGAIPSTVTMKNWAIGTGQVVRILAGEVWEAIDLNVSGILAVDGELTVTG